MDNDIVLVEMTDNVTVENKTRPICLDTGDYLDETFIEVEVKNPADRIEGTVTGWGQTTANQGYQKTSNAETLQKLDIPITVIMLLNL